MHLNPPHSLNPPEPRYNLTVEMKAEPCRPLQPNCKNPNTYTCNYFRELASKIGYNNNQSELAALSKGPN